jgi:Lrp/AsnC family transcriptional regulator for asnA, asnC and gidA
MIDLDKKDRKILFYLIHDSRQSLKSIGKKVGISKESTHYRINRLIKKEVIKNFSIFVNFRTFGYSAMMTHYKFININPRIKKEIIDFFVKSKYVFYVSLLEGIYDLQVDFLLGDPYKLEALLDRVREKYHKYLSFQPSKFYLRGEFYNYSFLLDDKSNKNVSLIWEWGHGLANFDEFDYKILSELAKNARTPTKTIANNLNSTIIKVNYRIKKIENKLLPLKYRKNTGFTIYTTNVDWAKIGYRWFHLQISMSDYNKKNLILGYLRKNPNIIRYFKFINLDMDLHFTFLLHNMEELRNIIEDLTTKFPDSINDYHFYSTFNVFKHTFLIPELLKIKNPLNREV